MESILFKNIRITDGTKDGVGDVLIEDGEIKNIIRGLTAPADRVIDGGNGRLAMIPGLFDMHVHFRDPGQTHKEDILTGCSAALAGGVTGVACMPNTDPPIDNIDTVQYITKKAKVTGVGVYPVGCITQRMEGRELYAWANLGVKMISDDGRPVENAELMRKALEHSTSNGLLVASHCEDLAIINGGIINKGEVSEKLGVPGMDRASEDNMTAREIGLAESAGARVHICHVSTKGSVEIIREAKKRGVKVTCETCPHYFTYTEQKLLSMDADYRMNPPLRTEEDRAAIIEGLMDGTIDCIVTDHAPHTKNEKADFLKAPNGVVGLETSLAVTLTQLYHTKKLSLKRIVQLMSVNPRKLLRIPVPALERGARAEIAVVDLAREWEVVPDKLHSKSRNTAFKGETLMGKNVMTISNGRIRYDCLK
ncbi:MAG: dihydroorotase [Oscillospiraceae bacterium]|nr:dihydroorotase [Oscillospiraceae bacterium]